MERVLALQTHCSNNAILSPPPHPLLPGDSPAAGQAALHMPTWLQTLAADWKANYELDRVLLPVAAAVMATHTAVLWRHGSLTFSENLQNLLFLVPLCATAALCRAAPAWYRPCAALLRCVLLLLGHFRPVFSSLGAMDPPVTGPCQVPLIGHLLDAFFLWMATKHCFLLFAAGTLRPPLYVALLVQASRRCASPLRLPLYIVVLVQASRHCPARIDTCLHPRLVAGRLGEEAGHCQTCRGRASAAGRQSERCQDMRHMLLDCRYLVQASGVWRANQAGFCTSAVLRHPVMQERTALVHSTIGLAYQALLGQPLSFAANHNDPEQQCRSLYLFCSLVFSFLLPLLLLIAMHEPSADGDGSGSDSAAAPRVRGTGPLSRMARLELWLQAQLGTLLWQPRSSSYRAGRQPWQRGRQAGVPSGLLLVALRWLLLALVLWAASRLVVEGL